MSPKQKALAAKLTAEGVPFKVIQKDGHEWLQIERSRHVGGFLSGQDFEDMSPQEIEELGYDPIYDGGYMPCDYGSD